MERVTIGDVEPQSYGEETHRRELSDLLGTSDVAISHYRIAPGDGFPGGLHAHLDQEEIFYVLSGEATFDWLGPDREASDVITVTGGEVVRFAPGEYKSGRNEAAEDLVALALGAPKETEEIPVPLTCPECGHPKVRPEWPDGETLLVCPDCGAENVPEGCPDCGADMKTALGDENETVVVCRDCGTEAPNPFGE